MNVNHDGVRRSAADLLRYPDMDLAKLSRLWPELAELTHDIAEQIEIDARYAGYLDRQEADIRAFRKMKSCCCPMIWMSMPSAACPPRSARNSGRLALRHWEQPPAFPVSLRLR